LSYIGYPGIKLIPIYLCTVRVDHSFLSSEMVECGHKVIWRKSHANVINLLIDPYLEAISIIMQGMSSLWTKEKRLNCGPTLPLALEETILPEPLHTHSKSVHRTSFVTHFYSLDYVSHKQTRHKPGRALVTHTCNSSYSGGRDQEDLGSEPAWANSFRDSI
jgi:hypothetical protein